MKKLSLLPLLTMAVFAGCTSPTTETDAHIPSGPVIVIHGGAGYIVKENTSDILEAQYLHSLQTAVDTGYSLLAAGHDAVDVVEIIIQRLENDTLFNAGRGAVVTREGKAELDASIMNGKDLNAGAVSGLMHIKHPISLARLVMDSSKHVMLSGQGAENYGLEHQLDTVPNSYFITNDRNAEYERLKAEKFGTVGVVVLDSHGNIAAGTSTGGMMLKEYGRIGDSPIIGAGTYADNNGAAVSCTGHGEFFIRYAVAHSISERVSRGQSPQEAADEVIHQTLAPVQGMGGVIVLDTLGRISMSFNTPGMFRGFRSGDSTFVGMYQ